MTETELQFLIRILTKEKLSAKLKDLFIERIGVVETNLVPKAHGSRPIVNFGPVTTATMPDAIAQTPAAAAALESRNLAIQQATSGKPEAGRTSPRKF
jgi:hypothetical protein